MTHFELILGAGSALAGFIAAFGVMMAKKKMDEARLHDAIFKAIDMVEREGSGNPEFREEAGMPMERGPGSTPEAPHQSFMHL